MFKPASVILFALSLLTSMVMIPGTFAAEVKVSHVLLKTSKGNVELELDNQNAPVSTKNFVDYVNEGYYNNTVFHRVIPGFMIQGGGFFSDMKPKVTKKPIKNEANNGLNNLRGAISMARTTGKDSATSQFFINVADNFFLDHNQRDFGYAVFGKVVKGMDVIDTISQVQTRNMGSHEDVPVRPVRILSATVLP